MSVGAGENVGAIVEANGHASAHPHVGSWLGRLARVVTQALQRAAAQPWIPWCTSIATVRGNGAA